MLPTLQGFHRALQPQDPSLATFISCGTYQGWGLVWNEPCRVGETSTNWARKFPTLNKCVSKNDEETAEFSFYYNENFVIFYFWIMSFVHCTSNCKYVNWKTQAGISSKNIIKFRTFKKYGNFLLYLGSIVIRFHSVSWYQRVYYFYYIEKDLQK